MNRLLYLYFIQSALNCVSVSSNISAHKQLFVDVAEPFYATVVGIIVLLMVSHKLLNIMNTLLKMTNKPLILPFNK